MMALIPSTTFYAPSPEQTNIGTPVYGATVSKIADQTNHLAFAKAKNGFCIKEIATLDSLQILVRQFVANLWRINLNACDTRDQIFAPGHRAPWRRNNTKNQS